MGVLVLSMWAVARVQFWPSALCRSSLLLGLALLQRFFSEFSCFHPFAKFQFNQDTGPVHVWKAAKTDVASSLNIIIYFQFLKKNSYPPLNGIVLYHRVSPSIIHSPSTFCQLPLSSHLTRTTGILQYHDDINAYWCSLFKINTLFFSTVNTK